MTGFRLAAVSGVLFLFAGNAGASDQALNECRSGCEQVFRSCAEQAWLNAGNIQEEQERQSACEPSKAGCLEKCDEEPPASSPTDQSSSPSLDGELRPEQK